MSLRAVKNGAVITGLALCPVVAILAGWPVWVVAIVAVWSFVVLHRIVQRRGGWRLFGPHLYFDLIRMSRKGRTALFRFLFLMVLVGAIFATYEKYEAAFAAADARHQIQEEEPLKPRPGGRQLSLAAQSSLTNVTARFNSACIYRWFLLQNIAILVLTPAYVGGAIAEERERGTLDLLFTSALYDREILLGKLVARITHLGGLLLAGLPIFSMMLVFGGVDMTMLLENWINSVLLLITASSICLMISTVPMAATSCVMISYAVVLAPGFCCSWSASGFPLVVDVGEFVRLSGGELIPKLVIIFSYALLSGFGLSLAFGGLRPKEPPLIAARIVPEPATESAPDATSDFNFDIAPRVIRPTPALPPTRDLFAPPLPPVGDNGLHWKERYAGGRSWLELPEAQIAVALFLAFGLFMILLANLDRHPASLGEALSHVAEVLAYACWGGYFLLLACVAIGVGFRAAGCVVREKQAHTLDMLLQLPIERSEILSAKWSGALLKGRPWAFLLVADLVVAVAFGGFSFPVAFLLAALSSSLVLFLCSLGLLISVVARTRLQAHVTTAMALLASGLTFGYLAVCIPHASHFSEWLELSAHMLVTLVAAIVLCLSSILFWLVARVLFERIGRGPYPRRFSRLSKRDDLEGKG
jgi:ABC-type transport system involved in multi-copper enzyme maturation permease subunit